MPSAARPRLPILISRAAGGGRVVRHEKAIRDALAPRYRLSSAIPTSLIELTRMLDEEVRAGTPTVAVGGGDGTLHHAVNAIGDAPDHARATAQRHWQRLLPQPGAGANAGAGSGRPSTAGDRAKSMCWRSTASEC